MVTTFVGVGLTLAGWGSGGARDGLFALGLAFAVSAVARTSWLTGDTWALVTGLVSGILLYALQRGCHG